jgi:hypothetical protein
MTHDGLLASAACFDIDVICYSNDCGLDVDPDNAGVRLKNMLEIIWAAIPTTTIVLSTIAKSLHTDACSTSISQQIRALITTYPADTRLVLADFNSAMSYSDIGSDGTHSSISMRQPNVESRSWDQWG